jgi:hypothetical protein
VEMWYHGGAGLTVMCLSMSAGGGGVVCGLWGAHFNVLEHVWVVVCGVWCRGPHRVVSEHVTGGGGGVVWGAHLDVLEHVRVVADLPQLHDGVHQGLGAAFALGRQREGPNGFLPPGQGGGRAGYKQGVGEKPRGTGGYSLQESTQE